MALKSPGYVKVQGRGPVYTQRGKGLNAYQQPVSPVKPAQPVTVKKR
jgi:hypothetical protein